MAFNTVLNKYNYHVFPSGIWISIVIIDLGPGNLQLKTCGQISYHFTTKYHLKKQCVLAVPMWSAMSGLFFCPCRPDSAAAV